MSEIITLIIIGVALSLDAFSLALSVGTISIKNKKNAIIAVFVGAFHFFMPLLGLLLGNQIMKIFHLSGDFLISIIFFYIAFEMIRCLINKEEICWNMNLLGIIAFSFGVSIDSFSIGLGLQALTDHAILAVLIFSICSSLFTYLGLLVGKYTKEKLGIVANIIGAVLLIILGITHLL